MTGCVVPDFTSRLKWVKVMVREVNEDGRHYYVRPDIRGFKKSFRLVRLLKDDNGKGSSRSSSTRERRRAAPADDLQNIKGGSRTDSITQRRQAAPGNGAYKHLQTRSAVKEAVAILIDRVYEGTTINSYKYVDILQGCFKQKDFESVKKVHDCIKKSRLEENAYVANTLLKCYIGCGRLQHAREVFNKLLSKNIVSWTTMIGGYAENNRVEEAIQLYRELRDGGGQPNVITYLNILKACASPSALRWGKDIHSHIIRDGHEADLRVCSSLVHMYSKCGSIEDARAVFDRMEERNIVCWNAMIGALALHGRGHEAFCLFQQMQREAILPDSVTYLCILSAEADPKDLAWVREVHNHASNSGFAQDVSVNNAVIFMYAKCGAMDDAKVVFDNMMTRDVISWNAMIGGLALHGLGHEAFSCFLQMQREGVVSDVATYLSILNSNACDGALGWVKEVYNHAAGRGLNADLRVENAFMHMYAKSGSIEDAKVVFDRMRDRNVVSWNVMIGALSEHGLGREAFSLFLQMQREGFTPDSITYLNILSPYSTVGALEWVKEVHTHAMQAGPDLDLRVWNAFVHMFAKIGSIADARQVFDEMPDPDVVSLTVMIGGLAQHGHGREAIQLFEEMITKGFKLTKQLFLVVLSACSHAGLVDEGSFQFLSMTRDHDFEPVLEHFNCMVDALRRAGHLEEAKVFILNMPIKPNIVTWKALLGGCRLYNNMRLAELAAKECLELEPMDPAPYVLLSNIYAAIGNWEQSSLVRSMMQERGVRKDQGRCWIEVDNKVHQFGVGDKSHPEAKEIYNTLDRLFEKLKAEGYTPDKRLVLRNIDEEYKESALCSHSERLAIAYGLMHVTERYPIRIFKNLRICIDCHTASKLISRVTGREIVARDATRFHHFKDGECSCGNYW